MYVWTARGKQSTVQILTELNIYGHFEDVCGFDCAERKPSVAGIEYLLPEVDPNKVIVIGDSLGDIIGGKKFGAYCIGAMWAHGEAGAAETYAEYGASASFLSVEECQKHIEKLIE